MQDIRKLLQDYIKKNSLTFQLGEMAKLAPIGEGGNGLVYAGELNGIPVAVKFLVNNASQKLQRFKAEYLNVVLLPANPFVAKPIAYEELHIESETFAAIILKKYDSALKRPPTPTLEDIQRLFSFLLDALKFIHSQGIIHRDLKPEVVVQHGERRERL